MILPIDYLISDLAKQPVADPQGAYVMPKPSTTSQFTFYCLALLAALIVVCLIPASAQETRGGIGGGPAGATQERLSPILL